jgi:hypothetical protein
MLTPERGKGKGGEGFDMKREDDVPLTPHATVQFLAVAENAQLLPKVGGLQICSANRKPQIFRLKKFLSLLNLPRMWQFAKLICRLPTFGNDVPK